MSEQEFEALKRRLQTLFTRDRERSNFLTCMYCGKKRSENLFVGIGEDKMCQQCFAAGTCFRDQPVHSGYERIKL